MFDQVITLGPMGDDSIRKILGSITNDERYMDNLIYMAKGNVGAANVLRDMHEKDPQVAPLCTGMLAAYNIMGPMLWLLYKDVNGQDAMKMMEMIQTDDEAPKALEALPYAQYERPKR